MAEVAADETLVLRVTANNERAASVARQAGRTLLQGGQQKEALSQFEKACQLERNNCVNFELCAHVMVLLGKTYHGEAKGKLARAIDLNAYSARARVLKCALAKAKAGVEELTPSTDINLLRELYIGYDEAWKLDPRINACGERRQEVEKLLKQVGAELPTFKGAVDPEVAKLRARGLNFLAKKKYGDAFNAFRECVQLEPENYLNHQWRCFALANLRAKGNPAEVAIRDGKRAVRLHHGSGEAWAALAIAFHRHGDLDWALDAWDQVERHEEWLLEFYSKDRAKLAKDVSKKGKGFTRREVPWSYDEEAPPLAGSDESRAEPQLEMDSMGGMTIRSQMKRVLMANSNVRPHLDLSPRPGGASGGAKSPRSVGGALRSPRPSAAGGAGAAVAMPASSSLSPSAATTTAPAAAAAAATSKPAAPAGPPRLPQLPAELPSHLKQSAISDDEEDEVPIVAPTLELDMRGHTLPPKPTLHKTTTAGGVDEELERFCRLIGGRVTRYEASMMTNADIPENLPLADRLFMRGFVAGLQEKK